MTHDSYLTPWVKFDIIPKIIRAALSAAEIPDGWPAK